MPLNDNFFETLLPKENEIIYGSPPRATGAIIGRSCAFAERCSARIQRIFARKQGKTALSLRSLLQNLISNIQPALEIGPFNKPFLNKKTAKFLDLCGRDELTLRAHALDIYQDDTVPSIDYVSPHGDLSIIQERFDLVFSSHVLEHQVDITRHLQQVHDLLNENGAYILAVPDYRYCFDHHKPETTIPDVLEAFYTKRKSHTLRDLLFAVMYDTHNDPWRHWRHDHGNCHVKPLDENVARLKPYLEMWQNNEVSGGYLDVHAWRFQPKNFRFTMEFLQKLGLITFDILRVYETNYNDVEFFAVLVKRGSVTDSQSDT